MGLAAPLSERRVRNPRAYFASSKGQGLSITSLFRPHREGGREGGGVLIAKGVGVFICRAPVILVNQVRSSREMSVSNMSMTRAHGHRKWESVQGGEADLHGQRLI